LYKEYHKIILLEEFKKKCEQEPSFINSSFTEEMIKEHSTNSLAGRYMVKECFDKLVPFNIDYREIEIKNNSMGKPVMEVKGTLKKQLTKEKIELVDCSISHSRERAVGYLILKFKD